MIWLRDQQLESKDAALWKLQDDHENLKERYMALEKQYIKLQEESQG